MKLITSISALLFSGLVCAAPIHKIVVFGDSLSDNGNMYEVMNHQFPPSPPYFQGRFSNGPVWIELIAASVFSDPKSHLQDYAIGGAGISEDPEDSELFTFRSELADYLNHNQDQPKDDTLFIVWIGGNNYLGIPPDTEETLQKVNTGIVHGLQNLVESGAKNIMVVNLPSLGATPAAREFDAEEIYDYFTKQHNILLANSYASLQQTYPQVNWLYFNMDKLFEESIRNPAAYGFTNVTDSCYESVMDDDAKPGLIGMSAHLKQKFAANACDGFLFFDLVHPTVFAGQIMADGVKQVLDNAGVEFSD